MHNLTFGIRLAPARLLGPNRGSTTINTYCTLSAGTAVVAGSDIHDGMTSIHQNLGFCPQFSGLFPLLTVQEHFEFYGGLRGMSTSISLCIPLLFAGLDMTNHLQAFQGPQRWNKCS